ncbi:MAG: TonB family protein [Spirochaetes bacterium]|nr:TonB family protein [Spirochaetota bacterium]
MTKRYSISISFSLVLHAFLLLLIFRIRIPVIQNPDSTVFSIEFAGTYKIPHFSGIKTTAARNKPPSSDKNLGTSENSEMGKPEIPLLSREYKKTAVEKVNSGILESTVTAPKKILPGTPAIIPEPAMEDILNDIKDGGSRQKSSAANNREPKKNSINWTGESRRIVKRGTIRFPYILTAEGQQAKVIARIYVSPGGNVNKVEILKSSGYIKVDNAVISSLRHYLFSPSGRDKGDIGIIEVQFKLKRED